MHHRPSTEFHLLCVLDHLAKGEPLSDSPSVPNRAGYWAFLTLLPGTSEQYPDLKSAGALGDASKPGMPADSVAASTHGRTDSHVTVAGGLRGTERAAAAAIATEAARRRGVTPTGGAVTQQRSTPARGGLDGRHGAREGGWDRPPYCRAPLTGPVDPVSNYQCASATETGAQAQSHAGYHASFKPPQSLRAVGGRSSGRWRGKGGQVPSGPCDPCGRAVLLSHGTQFALRVFATLAAPTLPCILEDTNAHSHL